MSTPLADAKVRYIMDEQGHPEAAVVPIETWWRMTSDGDAERLLNHPKMRQRLEESLASDEWIPMEEVMQRLGITQEEIDAFDLDAEVDDEGR
ncbi:MAG: hypothetical protein AAF561_16010 [Planctomycetota bacterium]